MGKLYIYDWKWQLKSSPEAIWPYVADTNHLNLVTGMPKIIFREEVDSTGTMHRYAHAPIYSWLAIDWEEVPFDWVKPRYHRVKRVFRAGLFPIKSLQNFFTLTPLPDGGTELSFQLTLESNGWWGPWFIPRIAESTHASFEAAFQQMDRFLQGQAAKPFALPPISLSAETQARLQNLLDELRESGRHDPSLVEHLARHIAEGSISDLTRIRPYRLAREWGAPRHRVLGLFLHATQLGIFDLSWDMLCPSCRGAKQHVGHLSDLPQQVHCPSCNIDYSTHFEQSIEATFNLRSDLALLVRTDYCIGGPHATPHVMVQQVLQPGESRQADLPIGPGYYRLRAPRLITEAGLVSPAAILSPIPGQPWLSVQESATADSLRIEIAAGVELSTSVIQAGVVGISLVNQTEQEQLLIWEDGAWSQDIATAADVTTLQAFRDLFSSEALRPGYTVSIQNLVVLFTDLKNSTQLYQRLGDASAFGRVIDHFDILRDAVADNRGGIVKTIGDAVMAVFREGEDAMLAALDMLKGIQDYNTSQSEEVITLKLGLHQGPCIAVNLNDRLDYFGSTVNIAARLEGQAQGGDLIFSEAVFNDPGVQATLHELGIKPEAFQANLKGFSEVYQLYRLRPLRS